MQLLSKLNSLDNVADGSTRKLLKTATSSGSGNAVTAVSISGDKLTYTLGASFSLSNHTHNNATTAAAGFMSASDKTKLNGIDARFSTLQTEINKKSTVLITDALESGQKIGTITIDGAQTNLYAPNAGSMQVSLSSPNQTYYLTGVQSTTSGQSDLYNSYLSSTYTGIKYITSTSNEGGSLYVDDREVVTGLYYEIS